MWLSIPWDDLAEWKARGMRVLEVHQLENAETELVVENLPAELEAEMAIAKSKLAQKIAEMYARARRFPGHAERAALPRGLGIDVVADKDGLDCIQIWRLGKYPGDREWQIVLGCLPCDVMDLKFTKRFDYQGRYYIQAGWAARKGA